MGRNGGLAQLQPALSLRHVRFAATAAGGSMTTMRAQSGHAESTKPQLRAERVMMQM
jgi:hypothetical protein